MSAGPACPKCGRVNRPGVKFCATCGTALSAAAPQQSGQIQSPAAPPQAPPRPTPGAQPAAPPQAPPRPSPGAQPAKQSRFALQPLYIAIIAAAVIGVLLCGALFFLFGSSLGLVPPSSTTVANLPASPTALIDRVTETPHATRTPIPNTATPIKETVVVIVTATPIPAETATLIPVTSTPLPSFTPAVTQIPPRTNTGTPSPQPSPLATTESGSTLPPGQFWVSDGMTMLVGAPRLTAACQEVMVEFPFTIQNTQPTELRLSLDGTQFILTDSTGEAKELYYVLGPNPQPCEAYKKLVEFNLNALAGNQKAELSIHARGRLLPEVTHFDLMVVRAATTENAKWNLPVTQ